MFLLRARSIWLPFRRGKGQEAKLCFGQDWRNSDGKSATFEFEPGGAVLLAPLFRCALRGTRLPT
jgi:hypothetical protein